MEKTYWYCDCCKAEIKNFDPDVRDIYQNGDDNAVLHVFLRDKFGFNHVCSTCITLLNKAIDNKLQSLKAVKSYYELVTS